MKHLDSAADVDIFQTSRAGVKPENQDTIGARVPEGALLAAKGLAMVIADGVSDAPAAQEASQACVTGFLTDYFATPDSWSVKTSAVTVIQSLNRWLHGQGQSALGGRGHLTTLTVLIIKSNAVHIFHVGDTRVYRFRHNNMELLTRDHSQVLSPKRTYLSRAVGADLSLDVDYRLESLQADDVFMLTSDGIHDTLSNRILNQVVSTTSLSDVPEKLCETALAQGSTDNVSCQIIRINQLQKVTAVDAYRALKELPFPPLLSSGHRVDGYQVIRELKASERSQLYLVEDDRRRRFVMKTPSENYSDDLAYIERFVLEEWIGCRVRNAHVIKVHQPYNRTCLYTLTDYIQGPTLAELIAQRAPLDIRDAVELIEQIGKALQAMHRKETLHQDIKPDNIIIAQQGAVLIDFGSCRVAGIEETEVPFQRLSALGTVDYAAPEYHYPARRSERSDQFSLAVVLYEMLTGHHPYGAKFSNAKSQTSMEQLSYRSATEFNPLVPPWLDATLHKALSIQPEQRYEALSEFIYDLHHPNPHLRMPTPLMAKHPLRTWQAIVALQTGIILLLCYLLIT